MGSGSENKSRENLQNIPHPDILTPVPKTLFECWKGVPCALNPSNGKLFSAAAWHQAQNTLKSGEDGLMSNPP